MDTSQRPGLQIYAFGRFRAEVDAEPVSLSPTAAVVLAGLVLARGDLVHADELYRLAWAEQPAEIARVQQMTVHRRILEIRRQCTPQPDALSSPGILVTQRSSRTGYRLLIEPDQVDIYRFEDLVLRGTATRDAVTTAFLTRALSLWTQPPLQGLPSTGVVGQALASLIGLRDRACRDLAVAAREQNRWPEAVTALTRLQRSVPSDLGLQQLIHQLQNRTPSHSADPATPSDPLSASDNPSTTKETM
jgi:hypothetical protein